MISRALFAMTLLASTCSGAGLGPLSIDDVDGDGRADLVMVTSIAGRQLMAVSSRDDRTLWIYTPRDSYSPTFGGAQGASFAVLCADRDGDGARDVAVAWTSRADGDVPEHALVAVHSSRTGRVLAWHSLPCSKDDRPGSLIEVGDLDGDSRPELLLGMPGFERKTGIVYALSGVDLVAREFARGTRMGEQFGFALQPLGDVDGDGVDDVAIGSPGAMIECTGVISIVSGRTGEPVRVIRGSKLTRDAEGCTPNFGSTFAAASEIEPHAPSNLWVVLSANEGRSTDVALVSTQSGSVIERVRLPDIEAMDMVSLQLSPAGDWDDDGVGDVILRDEQWNRLGPDTTFVSDIGHVRIVGLRGELERWEGRVAHEYVGRGVALSRDRDSNGRPMLWIVSSPDWGEHPVVRRHLRGEPEAQHSVVPTRNELPEVPR